MTGTTFYESHTENNHGDVCRVSKGYIAIHKCPPGCTQRGGPPWCSMSGSTTEPCRTRSDSWFLYVKTHEDCVHLHQDFDWKYNDDYCSAEKHSICKCQVTSSTICKSCTGGTFYFFFYKYQAFKLLTNLLSLFLSLFVSFIFRSIPQSIWTNSIV